MKSWLDSDSSAEDALGRFAMKRFYNTKCLGVTQPSQRKYVHYFCDLLTGKINLKTPPVVLRHVIIHGIPNCDGKGGCRVFLKVYVNMKLEHTSGLYVSNGEDKRIKITLHGGSLNIQGEVLLKCFHKRSHSRMDSVFRCQFHTAIVRDTLRLVFKKEDLDDAFKDKRFPESARVEMLFEADKDGPREDVDLRSSLLDTTGATASTDLPKDESLSKRDSYSNFEGGFDTGSPDKIPDLIRFSPISLHQKFTLPPADSEDLARKQISDAESTDSFHMDPQNTRKSFWPPQPPAPSSKVLLQLPAPCTGVNCDEVLDEDVESPQRPS
jgi:hypothetical protein